MPSEIKKVMASFGIKVILKEHVRLLLISSKKLYDRTAKIKLQIKNVSKCIFLRYNIISRFIKIYNVYFTPKFKFIVGKILSNTFLDIGHISFLHLHLRYFVN